MNHFFDMDGTLAEYSYDAYAPKDGKPWYQKLLGTHYFRHLKPYYVMLDKVNALLKADSERVFILTSVEVPELDFFYEMVADKAVWVNNYLEKLKPDHFLVIKSRRPTSGKKTKSMLAAEVLGRSLTSRDYLYDDFNLNLEEWRSAGGTPIKVLNGINSWRDDMECIKAYL